MTSTRSDVDVAFDLAAIGMALLSRHGNILKVNRSLCELLDRDTDDLLGTAWSDLSHPEDRTESLLPAALLASRGEHVERQKRYLRPDGTVVTARVTWAFVVIDGARVFFVQVNDVTEEVAALAGMCGSERRFEALTRGVTDAVYWLQLRPEVRCRFVNDAAAVMTGCPVHEFYADPTLCRRIVHPQDRHLVEDLQADADERLLLLRWVRHDGSFLWVEQRQLVLAESDGEVTDVLGIARDVTDRIERDRAWAHHSAQRDGVSALATICIKTGDPRVGLDEAVGTVDRLMDADLTAVWWEVEPGGDFRLVAGVGFSRLEVGQVWAGAEGSHAALVRRNQACTSFDNTLLTANQAIGGELAAERVVSGMGVSILSGGRAVGALAVYFRFSASVDPQDALFLQAVANTLGASADQSMFTEHLRDLAVHDSLTGFLNRSALVERLSQILETDGRHARVVVAACDIDDFGLLNEAMGSDAADQVLVEVATRLQEVAGPDSVVARSGNDEFAVIVLRPDRNDSLEMIGSEMTAAFRAPISVGAEMLAVTVSIGLAVGASGDIANELVAAALVAVHGAQGRGRARWMVASAHRNTDALRRLELTSSLRGAAERGEIPAYLQPIVTLHDGDIVGFEALARWKRPTGVMVLPDDFIPIAERTGFINDIGLSMLQQACTFLEERLADDHERALKVAVNVSPRQLEDPDFPRRVEEILVGCSIPRLAICLELTESAIVPGDRTMLDHLHALKRLGVTLAIDDFGTGYSSFAYLSQFPIDLLKLDRTFVTGLQDDPRRIAVVGSIITLAATLGIHVLAEGIETSQERDVLAGLDCEFGQGFLWGRPVPACDVGA